MALQEFLASYAVEVDESGAKRLEEVLESNRDLAERLAGAFDAARSALSSLNTSLETLDLQSALQETLQIRAQSPWTVPAELGLTAAESSAESFAGRLESLRPKLSANASGITSAVSSAIASIRSMMASVSVTVPVRAIASPDLPDLPRINPGTPAGAASSAGSGRSASAASPSVPAFGSGGRVASPTFAMIAEKGDPEYVIPVKKEAQAVPLLRDLLSELSVSARKALSEGTAAGQPAGKSGMSESGLSAGILSPAGESSSAQRPDLSSFSADLASMMSSARSAFLPVGIPQSAAPKSVEAPVTINVTAASASPEEIGRSVYDLTQRYLLRTVRGVFS